MSSTLGGSTAGHQAALEAVSDLRETRDAYAAIQSLLEAPEPQNMMIERVRISALLSTLNKRFKTDLDRAEAAVRAVATPQD